MLLRIAVDYVAVSGASRDRVLTLARLAADREPQDDVAVALTRRAQRSGTSTMAAESQICHYRRVRRPPWAASTSAARARACRSAGAGLTVGPRGRRATVGIPGSGIFWTQTYPPAPAPHTGHRLAFVLVVVAVPVAIYWAAAAGA